MNPFTANFTQKKQTKGTFVYEEQPEGGQPPRIGSLYVRKWALGNPAPLNLTVIVK